MAKALLEYTFLFEPGSNTWTNLFQFEGDLGKFFASKGLQAQIIKTVEGATGKRIYEITAAPVVPPVPQPKDGKPAQEQIKQVQQKQAPQKFKQFIRTRPQSAQNAPRMQFKRGTSDLRQDVHKLPHVNFRRVKR